MANREAAEVANRGVVFLEANPFASRLHVLEPLVQAVGSSASASVVTPARASGTDLDAFLEHLGPGAVYCTVGGIRESSSRIGFLTLFRLLLSSRRILLRHDSRVLVLTAVDDYFFALPFMALFIRILLRDTRVFVVRYRVADLVLGKASGSRQVLKRLCVQVVKRLVDPEIVIFDERVPATQKLHILPDPWTGPFGTLSRQEARKILKWKDDDEVILLVGGQDERKGFDVAVTALLKVAARRSGVRVVLVGRVDSSMKDELDGLAECYGDAFIHIASYIRDEEIALYFAAATTILLPYHTAFTSTSGVLVRAAASSTPVVASNHGLVGWRTERHSLGLTFAYPRDDDLANKIVRIIEENFDPTYALLFAHASTKNATVQAFRKALNG